MPLTISETNTMFQSVGGWLASLFQQNWWWLIPAIFFTIVFLKRDKRRI